MVIDCLFRQQKLEKVMDQEGLADEEVSDKHTLAVFSQHALWQYGRMHSQGIFQMSYLIFPRLNRK